MNLPSGDFVCTKRYIFLNGYDDPVLIVKMTLLLFSVSSMGTLNDGMFISSHFLAGIVTEPV
jgi:hypothetical protein